METFDAIILGSGQGGNPLAKALTEAGKKTALVERRDVGGTCINRGCTPTKTMVASARVAYLARRGADYGVNVGPVELDMVRVRERKRAIVSSFRQSGEKGLEKAHVELIRGEASFAGPRRIHVALNGGGAREITAEQIFINTGARSTVPALPGLDAIPYFDHESIMELDYVPEHLVIIGGGYIGLEVAATARELGLDVTVLEMADRVMNRVTCKEVSTFYETEHARHGVRIITNSKVQSLAGDPQTRRVKAVLTDDGAEHPADVVLVGVGVVAADELAIAAGLECANGITVDEYCRTSDPAIFAAGDCVNAPNLHYGRRLRLESVDNAFEQAATAAHNLLGTPTVHDKVPWFWSDQFDLKMIIVGLCQGHDTVVVRGSAAARSFSACYLRDGELIAIDSINSPKDQMAARKLIAARARPHLEKLANAAVALKDTV